jgi:hypothetical protein
MNTIDLNKDFLNLRGERFSDNQAETLANILASHTENPAKCMTWATELIKTGILTVDDIDLDWIVKLITGYHLSNIVKTQLLDTLKGVEG